MLIDSKLYENNPVNNNLLNLKKDYLQHCTFIDHLGRIIAVLILEISENILKNPHNVRVPSAIFGGPWGNFNCHQNNLDDRHCTISNNNNNDDDSNSNNNNSSSCLLRDLTCLVIKYINITWKKACFC